MKRFTYATALIACFGSFTAQAVTLPIMADSYVTTSTPTVNYGIATNLKVNANNKALLRFNASTLPSAVVSTDIYKATLVFHNQVTTGGAVQIRTLSGTWTETGVSYNTLPSMSSVAVNSVLVNSLANYTTADITNIIKNWLLAPSTNFGLLIEPDALHPNTDIAFDSQENSLTSHAAYIEVVLRGQTGAKGDKGDTGAQGLQGLRGLTGQQGPMGLTGPRGLAGAQGIQGLRGLTGATGARGPMGVPGPNTPNGNITMLSSTSANVGNIFKNANSFIHNYGTSNTFIGELAGNFTTTATENTALGSNALAVVTTGSYNTATGFEGLKANTAGQKNAALGHQTLLSNTTGSDNVASGFQAMYTNDSGYDNVAVGMQSLYWNTTGFNNIALGYRAGFNRTTGSGNIDIGNQGVNGESNTIRLGTTGTQSATYIAGISGVNITSGAAVCIDANGKLGTVGCPNTASNATVLADSQSNAGVGGGLLLSNTTGSYNVVSGFFLLHDNTTGSYNVGSGYDSLRFNITGNNNTSIGHNALKFITSGSNNIAVGYEAGIGLNGADSNNINIGNSGTAGESNIIRIGNTQTDTYLAGVIHGDGSGLTNVPVFTGSLVGDITGTQGATVVNSVGGSTAANINLATIAANTATDVNTVNTLIKRDASGNFAAGTITAKLNGDVYKGANTFMHSYGTANTFVGELAGNLTTTGAGENTAVGNRALTANTSGFSNSAIGSNALLSNTTGTQNVAAGVNVLYDNTAGAHNVGVGDSALRFNTLGNNSTAIGDSALFNNTTGLNNIGLGYQAGFNLTSGSNNIDIGNQGVAGESNIIRIGTAQTDTYLTGVIHGDGSGLTGLANSVNFSGSLVGDVTGTQGATLVASVGGSTAANVNLATVAANAATNANTASTIVKRDASGNFLTTGVTLSGNLTLPATTATTGIIYKGANRFLHNFGGSSNIFVGEQAGNLTMTGINNVGNGNQALFSNTTGAESVAIGASALNGNTSGIRNTATGRGAMRTNTVGNNNVANGFDALRNSTGSNNIAVGSQSGLNLTTGSNNIDIGNSGVAAESSTMRFGTVGTHTGTYIAGINGSSTTSGSMVCVDSSGKLGTAGCASSSVSNIALPTTTATTGILSLGGNRFMHNYGTQNTFVGELVGNFTLTGIQNTSIGYGTLSSVTTGGYNVANGFGALFTNTTGDKNTALGSQALTSNIEGNSNVSTGFQSMYSNTSGNDNLANGVWALYYNTTGSNNVALGNSALFSNIDSSYNTAVGDHALSSVTSSSSYNTAVGYNALVSLDASSGGTNNTAIGNGADVDVGALPISNATAIGNGAIVMASNAVRIGNDSVTEIGGQVAWSTLSDKRLKTNIIKSNKGLDFILKLQPVTYQWKKGDTKTVYDGFIAQDVEAAIKAAGFTSFSALHKPQNAKAHYSLEYSTFVMPLVNAVKEENALIKQQAAINKQQAAEIAALKAQVAQLTALFNAQNPK